jgi:hypothetical protein
MAKVALDLTQFRSAGVYTVEVDNSERIVVTTQSLRLIPGFSGVGPFNTPVFIRSSKDLQKFYGLSDPKLERKGSFFHRSITTSLLAAPVFAINLLATDNTNASGDKIEFIGLGLNSGTKDPSARYDTPTKDLYVNFFNRQRFWTPDTEYLQGVVTNKYALSSVLDAPLFQFVNTGTKKLSFIIRKAQGLNQYSVPAKDWYGTEANIPFEWIRPNDFIKDYFIQVIVVEGDWTNYSSLSTDPYYAQFFNASGLIPTQISNFINGVNVNLVGSWTGTIIPDFKDQTGATQYIETIINSNTSLTGVLLNINNQALDQLMWSGTNWTTGDVSTGTNLNEIDLIGHNLISSSTNKTAKFLSYEFDVSNNVIHKDVSISTYPGDLTSRKFAVDASNAGFVTVGSLMVKAPVSGTPTGVTYVVNKYWDGSTYVIQTAEAVTSGNAVVQKTLDDASICAAYKFITLDGLSLTNKHIPGFDTAGAPNLEAGVTKIYSMLEDSGIYRGLTNKEMINYRYIVDTMAYGLSANMGGKAYLSRLAKGRGKCTAILNAPAISQFAASTDPYFCDTFVSGQSVPVFSTEWIAQGGNPDMQRSFRFSFPSEEDGAKYCGVFGPFLRYSDGAKLINVPPAADVTNAYVRKFLGGDPFAIVANRNGILSNPALVGVEYMIDKVDRDFLEPFGYNSIIQKATTGQIMIYSNATAFQIVKSDFNNLHVRELLNTLEIQIEEALEPYVFTFNNPVTRLNAVNSVTPILETTKDAGALLKYEIVMDETNNSKELIADGFGIIDINVWVTGALTKIVNRITVNTEAGLSSGGFAF